MLRFGVGCWSFEPVGARAGDEQALKVCSDEAALSRAVKETLESVPTVQNVRFSGLRMGMEWGEPDAEDDATHHVLRARRFLPHPYAGRLDFDVEIPATVQTRLGYTDARLVGERFAVQLRYTDLFPVLYVTQLDAGADFPSAAVVLVREYLLDEFKRRDPSVNLRVLGPSPFWADFAVDAAAAGSTVTSPAHIEVARVAQRTSYDDITFRYDTAAYRGDQDAVGQVFDLLEDELALYYELQMLSQARLRKWVEVSENVDELVILHQATGAKAVARRWRTAGRLSRQLALRIIQVEAETTRDQQRGRRKLQEIYQGFSLAAVRADCEATLDAHTAADYPGAKELVSLLDARRMQDINVAALIASSTLGGVIGALVTAAAS